MEKLVIILIVNLIILAFFIGGMVGDYLSVPKVVRQVETKIVQSPKEKVYVYEYAYPTYEEIMRDVYFSHDYDVENYNCLNYSKDALDRLRNAGYITRMVCAWNSSNIGHAYLELTLYLDVTANRIVQNRLKQYDAKFEYCETRYFP